MSTSKMQIEVKIASNNTGFETIKDPLEIRRAVQKAIDIEAEISIQLRNPALVEADNSTLIFGKIESSSQAGKFLNIKFSPHDTEELQNQLSKKNNTNPLPITHHIDIQHEPEAELLSMIYLKGQVIICAPLRIISSTSSQGIGIISVLPPKRIFRLQRRKHLRLEISKAYQINLHYQIDAKEIELKHRLTNLTIGGLAFQVMNQREMSQFKVGTKLSNLHLIIRGEEVKIEQAVVRHIAHLPKVPTPQGVAVGIEFTSINSKDEEKLFQYVLQNAGYSMF